MFKWITKKAIVSLIKDEIKKIKEVDIKNKLIEYIDAHKEEVIEKAKAAIEKLVKNLVAKIVEGLKSEGK